MGGLFISLRLEPEQNSPTPLLEVYDAFAHFFVDTLDNQLYGEGHRDVIALYLREELSDRRETAQTGPDELDFVFKDAAGCCRVSSAAAVHWFELLLALLDTEFAALASTRGYRLATSPRPLDELVSSATGLLLIELDNRLCEVTCDPDGDSVELSTDSTAIAYESLPEPQRARVNRVIDSKLCHCQLCRGVRYLLAQRRTWDARTARPPVLSTEQSEHDACYGEQKTLERRGGWSTHGVPIIKIACSPTANRVALIDRDGRLMLRSGQTIIHEHDYGVPIWDGGLYFSPDGNHLLVKRDGECFSSYKCLDIHDGVTGAHVANWHCPNDVMGVGFAADSSAALTGCDVDPGILIQSIPEGDIIGRQWLCGHELAVSPNGLAVAVDSDPSWAFVVHEAITMRVLLEWHVDNWITRLVFAPDGRHLAIAIDGHVQILDLESAGAVRMSLSAMEEYNVENLLFSSSGRFLVVQYKVDEESAEPPPDGTRIMVWDLNARSVVGALGLQSEDASLGVSCDEAHLVLAAGPDVGIFALPDKPVG